MSDLKAQLIRLGYAQPDLRPHLRAVLADLERDAVRVEVSPQVKAMYALFKEQMDTLDLLVDRYGVDTMDNRYIRRQVANPIIRMAGVLARGLSAHILEDRDVPRRDLKKLERALHVIQKMRRAPNKPGTWWSKNKRHMEVIYNTRTYLTRDDSDSDLSFELRGFNVFNSIRAEGQEMDEIRDIIERGVDAMERSGISVVPKLLYGNLKIVGKITRSDTLAWYDLKADDVSVRTRISQELDAVHSFVHELGHRWWNRFLDRDIKTRWRRHHNRLRSKPSDYPLPDVGDPLGFPVRGIGENPIVRDITYGRGRAGRRFFLEGSDGYINESQVRKFLKSKNFPTRYASTDAEEHFCESFAMYCLGTLHQDHRDAFDEIVLGRDPAPEVVVPVVEEVADPEPTFLGLEESRDLLREIRALVGKEKTLVGDEDIMEGGSEESGVDALFTRFKFELETSTDLIPYELSVEMNFYDDELVLNAHPVPFDNEIENLKVDLPGKGADDLARFILRQLRDYEEGLLDMVAPGSTIVSRPKPSSLRKPGVMSRENAQSFLEDVVKVLARLKLIETASKPAFVGEGVQTRIQFEFQTPTGNAPYTLTLSITDNTLTANAEPKVFDGNIENKTLQLDPSRSSEDVAKAIARLLQDYEEGLEEMVSF